MNWWPGAFPCRAAFAAVGLATRGYIPVLHTMSTHATKSADLHRCLAVVRISIKPTAAQGLPRRSAARESAIENSEQEVSKVVIYLTLSRFFDHLVDLVPAKFYHGDSENLVNLRTMKKAARAAAKQDFKAAAKENKRVKLDPDAPATALEMQKAHVKPLLAQEPSSAPSTSAAQPRVNLGGSMSREELKAKLHKKIESIQQQRSATDKQAVAQAAKQWRDSTLANNAKHKQQQQQGLSGNKRKGHDASTGGMTGDACPSSDATEVLQPPGKIAAAPRDPASKAAGGKATARAAAKAAASSVDKEDEGASHDFQFAKLEFEGRKPVTAAGRKPKLSKEQLLLAAEAKAKAKVEGPATEEDKVKVIQDAWQTALMRAANEKVLDDPKLLRKSLKKDAKRKEKSARQWQERRDHQAEQSERKQNKRKEALQLRTEKKIGNKREKREKKLLVLAPWALHFLFLRTPSHQCLASAQYSARNEVEGSKEAAQHPSDPSTSALTAEGNSCSAAAHTCQACAQHALRVQALICERQAEHEARLRAEHQLRKLQAVLSPTAKASRVQIAKLNASKSLALLKLADQVAIDDNTPRLHTAPPAAAAVPAAALAAACIRAPIGTPSSAPVQAHSNGPGATLSSPVHATPCTTVTKATEQVPTAISGSPPATPSHNPAPTLPHPLAAAGPSAFSAPSPVSPTTASSAPGAGAVSKGHRAQPPPLTPTFGDRAAVFAFRPIGYLQSCFTTRNGTPRQPLLVSQARARLVLDPELPQVRPGPDSCGQGDGHMPLNDHQGGACWGGCCQVLQLELDVVIPPLSVVASLDQAAVMLHLAPGQLAPPGPCLLVAAVQASLDGLTQWSHVWVLYVFHDNTESRLKAGTSDWSGLKAKVHVPRLNGAKQGVFATRTPHRPSPIGLSVAQVISVHNNTVVLGGADIVDGSPVLDLKPYLPFCDSLPGAMAPCYVQAELDGEEPLAVSQGKADVKDPSLRTLSAYLMSCLKCSTEYWLVALLCDMLGAGCLAVHLTDTAATQLTSCWAANQHRSLYSTPSDFIKLVTQVLARDIRSLRQRLHEGAAAQARNLASTASAAALTKQRSGEPGAAPMSPAGSGTGVFHVVIEGVDVSYDITDDGPRVLIGGASLTSPLAQQHALKHRG
ncbi:hypothetical protein QJQ45_023071 [Haematococcus lacustris]|nr:hypothetical protein QJQ45_023071 [Haematococcus lacustris]